MSQENVEIIRSLAPSDGTDLVDLFESGGFPDGPFADNVVIRFTGMTGGALGGVGPDAIDETWAEWLSAWESYHAYWEEIIDRGDRVVMLVRLRGVSKHGGLELEQEAAAVFRFEGGLLVDIEFTLDRDAALRESA